MQWTIPSVESAAAIGAPEWMAVSWFVILGALLAMYAMLDGFDLGVGIVHFAAGRNSVDRAAQLAAIGPVWDGNEVWLVVFGGALFAAFPVAYATIFSALYLPLILLLFCLILRAATIELRHVFHRPRWHLLCDAGFCLSSLLIAALFGVAVGALMQGLPLNELGEFAPGAITPGPLQSVLALISPFSLAVGVLAVSLCATHGAAYLGVKSHGAHAERCRRVAIACWMCFFACVLAVTVVALLGVPAATRNLAGAPWLWVVAAAGAAATLWALRCLLQRKALRAFVGTALMSAALVALFMAALFPDLVLAAPGSGRSIGIVTAASTRFTLLMMFFVVLVAAPLVCAYTLITYTTFRGRSTDGIYADEGHP